MQQHPVPGLGRRTRRLHQSLFEHLGPVPISLPRPHGHLPRTFFSGGRSSASSSRCRQPTAATTTPLVTPWAALGITPGTELGTGTHHRRVGRVGLVDEAGVAVAQKAVLPRERVAVNLLHALTAARQCGHQK